MEMSVIESTAASLSAEAEHLLPNYVYILLDPTRDNVPFYVGKGTGNRVRHHELDLRRELAREDHELNIEEANAKKQTIHRILEARLSPIEVVVGRYEHAIEAFAVEAALMHFVFGRESLCNIQSGHGSRYLRTKAQFQRICAEGRVDEVIPGIDIERRVGIRNGEFTNDKKRRLDEAGIPGLFEDLQNALADAGFPWRGCMDDEGRYPLSEPGNGMLGLIVRLSGNDFSISVKLRKEFTIRLVATPSTMRPESRKVLAHMADQVGFSLGEMKKPHDRFPYFNLMPTVRYTSLTDLVSFLEALRSAGEACFED